jgi:hypothetical protein
MNKEEILQAIDDLKIEASNLSEPKADTNAVIQAFHAGIRHVLHTMEKIEETVNCSISSDNDESDCYLELHIDPVIEFLKGHGSYADRTSTKINLYCESIKESHIMETMKNLGFTITPTETPNDND